MNDLYYELEGSKPFSESLIWQINRDFYHHNGIAAWSKNIVPHHMTSNSFVGRTYAEMILAFLKDLSLQGKNTETVYILELGAGHGRLAYHILKHLEKLTEFITSDLPPFCYVLSDIVEENLSFFQNHPQLQTYYSKGTLDVTYFDALESKEMILRKHNKTISTDDLEQPLLVLANYFFDTLPTDLFMIEEEVLSSCAVALHTQNDPSKMSATKLLKNVELTYTKEKVQKPFYKSSILNELLEQYRQSLSSTHLFFPAKGIQCLINLEKFSKEGLFLISMDKGFHELHDLENKIEPEIITHGSFSLWVNFHALGSFCERKSGKSLFPEYSNFHLNIAGLFFLKNSARYTHTINSYDRHINDFGPDDFNSLKKLTYQNVSKLTTKDLLALFRLSHYDSTFFTKLFPRLKQVAGTLTFNERRRLSQVLHNVWEMYFSINENYDLPYEIGGMFYDLGFYQEALTYFSHSTDLFGPKADILYNEILCYYQLREDERFFTSLKIAKEKYPNEKVFESLDKLDMTSV